MALVGVPFLESLSHSFYRCPDLETRWPILKPAKWLLPKKCPELGTLPYKLLSVFITTVDRSYNK